MEAPPDRRAITSNMPPQRAKMVDNTDETFIFKFLLPNVEVSCGSHGCQVCTVLYDERANCTPLWRGEAL
jgi:hypothetical protein